MHFVETLQWLPGISENYKDIAAFISTDTITAVMTCMFR